MSVLNETDIYREFRPPSALRRSIACLWVRRGDGGAVRVVPDTCTDIVWRSGHGAVVAGPDTRAWLSRTHHGETLVGARFLPGAGGPALGRPLEELRDQRVELSTLRLERTDHLDGALDPSRALEQIAELAYRLAGTGAPDRAVQAGVVRLRDRKQRVERLADELGLSERQLRRRFLTAVGYGPKTLQRVLRLRRFLARATADDGRAPVSLAQAALDAGYADQAHLTRECRALTALTARELIAPRRPPAS
jgi:AraC-like DNA-binding protein